MSSESGFCQYFCLIVKISYNLMIGASTVILEFSYAAIPLFFMAHLSHSHILLSSTTIATIFMKPSSVTIMQFNSGQNVMLSRYVVNNDYHSIKRVISLHKHCLIGSCITLFFISAIAYFMMGLFYPNQEELVKWIRIKIIVNFIICQLTILIEFYRNIYIALCQRAVTLLLSSVAVGFVIFFGWLLGFYFGFGFWGVNIGVLIAGVLWFLQYSIYFNYSKSFESFWQNIEKEENRGQINDIETLNMRNPYSEGRNLLAGIYFLHIFILVHQITNE